jgi:hypothetical protein
VPGTALDVSELLDDLKERIRPFKTRMFPQQVLLELSETALVGQGYSNGRVAPISINVPLPSLTIKEGVPIEVEPLADLIGDLLVRDGLIDAYVMASLPQAAVDWRVIDWGEREVPDDGVTELRELAPDLGLPYGLEEAAMDLRPLVGGNGKQLLATTRLEVVENWIKVFHQAGTNLDRLACPQTCRLSALEGLLEELEAGALVVLLTMKEGGAQLLAIRDGVPLFEWPLPAKAADQVGEVTRCVAFLRREFRDVERVELLLEGEMEGLEGLEEALGVGVRRIQSEPYGSLVMQGLAIPEPAP